MYVPFISLRRLAIFFSSFGVLAHHVNQPPSLLTSRERVFMLWCFFFQWQSVSVTCWKMLSHRELYSEAFFKRKTHYVSLHQGCLEVVEVDCWYIKSLIIPGSRDWRGRSRWLCGTKTELCWVFFFFSVFVIRLGSIVELQKEKHLSKHQESVQFSMNLQKMTRICLTDLKNWFEFDFQWRCQTDKTAQQINLLWKSKDVC